MRRFRSTLQALLTVRQRQERLAMERYSEALQARQRAATALSTADQIRVQASEVLKQRLSTGIQAAEAMREQSHYKVLETRRDAAQHALTVAENAIPPALKGMLTARQQREAVEECITRQRERHQRDQQNQERKLLDELALRRRGPVRTFANSD
jgi:flagellar export protein FliJ